MLNLIRLSNESQLEFKTLSAFVSQMDALNVVSNVGFFSWLKVDAKMKWDQTKPARFNQDNQREDDLRRLREISGYLVKCKLMEDKSSKLVSNSSSSTTTKTYSGGMYCRIENEWKQRNC